MAYGVLINNTSGQSIVDTRTDKLNVVVSSAAENCLQATRTVISNRKYASTIGGGNYTTFGAPNNLIDTIWTATSSGTLNTASRVAPLKIVSAPGITSTNHSSSGIIVTNAPPSNAAKQFNVFLPDNVIIANGNIGLANYVAIGSRIIEYIAVRF